MSPTLTVPFGISFFTEEETIYSIQVGLSKTDPPPRTQS